MYILFLQLIRKYAGLLSNEFGVFLLPALILLGSCQDEHVSPPNNGQPFISEITPASGRTGNIVSITGGNFSKDPQANAVYFQGVRADVQVGIDEELLVKVPAGARSGPVRMEIPGFGSIEGPVFTVEKFVKPTIYWLAAGNFCQAVFDDNGTAAMSVQYTFDAEKSSLSFASFELDEAAKTFYFTEFESGRGSFIQKVNYGTGTLDTLYDQITTPLLETLVVSHLTLDLQNNVFYGTAYRNINQKLTSSIIRGALDGSTPLEIIYESEGLATDIHLALGTTHLYWTDKFKKQILKTSLTSFSPEVLYDAADGIVNPAEIAIDEPSNQIFFTDDPLPKDGVITDRIMKGAADGSGTPVTLLTGESENVYDPAFGLAFDAVNNTLYWVTRVRNQVQSKRFMRLDFSTGSPRTDILFEVGLRPEDGPYESVIYFSATFNEEGSSGGRTAANGRIRPRRY
jgi:hypothetical protein